MLSSLGRILEISTAANIGSWLEEDRRHGIEAIQSKVKRSLSRLILDATLAQPNLATASLDAIARSKGLKYLGCGVEFSVY